MARIALVDGNSFYASCEEAFQPWLKKRPVVVLSNNDGCIVAANARAKQLDAWLAQQSIQLGQGGFKAARPTSLMYQPYFKVAPYLKEMGAAVFSSNYELYADMSARMHSLLGQCAPRQEIYSIDECFLDLAGLEVADWTEYGRGIQSRIAQGLGLPVAVGIAATHTLAKLANHLAKRTPAYAGVLDLAALSESAKAAIFATVPVSSVWGIGQRLTRRLHAMGVETVRDFIRCDPRQIRRRFSVREEKILRELRGESCLSALDPDGPNQQIRVSRSFGQPVTQWAALAEAMSAFAQRAGEKLRRQNATCQAVNVMLRTNPHAPDFYQAQATQPLVQPTQDTRWLIKQGKALLAGLWQPERAYRKVQVTLSHIQQVGPCQVDCWASDVGPVASENASVLMATMDELNKKMGRGAVQFAAAGMRESPRSWQMRRSHCSPRYTTRWDELMKVH
ncbi:Y-family DNA polymerase [Thiomicrospira sp. WB1]|uniref:Y-family DNA polymerase n=1 Tax=Thiomicrospira sp. WB1 TaxID=1685380 RepID=UPI00074AD12D|nr:Y-family DNA polymerase [Thiomicrospira sp. WB1]KUJ71573.1 DNA polymerase [Thiomicrospira sp. WB1]